MSTTSTLPDLMPATGTLSPDQAANFVATVADDSKLVRYDEIMGDAVNCLYWFQRPFAKLLIRNPGVVKFTADPEPSKWDRRVDAAERQAAKRAEKAARADLKAKTDRFLQGLEGL